MSKKIVEESERSEYIKTFFIGVQDLMEKKRFSKRARLTKVSGKDTQSTWTNGLKREYTLIHKKSSLTFTVEIRPWMWTEGSVWVEIEFIDAKKLNIPKKMVKPKTQGTIWNANYDPMFFLSNTSIVQNFINAVELTIMDVSFFDSIKAAAENFFVK